MVQLTVIGHPKATCTQRVLILLEELELKYTLEEVDLSKQEHKEVEFLSMQPFGKVPVVKYGDKVLFESRSILRYISKNNRETADLFGDVHTDIWLEVESQNFNPSISKIVSEKMFKKWKGEEADEIVVAENLKALESVLDVYEKRLEGQEFIGGETFTIADISHIPYAYAFLKCGYKDTLKARPNVYSWLKRIMRREAVKSVLDSSFTKE
jgi:glutathione S-transferase